MGWSTIQEPPINIGRPKRPKRVIPNAYAHTFTSHAYVLPHTLSIRTALLSISFSAPAARRNRQAVIHSRDVAHQRLVFRHASIAVRNLAY